MLGRAPGKFLPKHSKNFRFSSIYFPLFLAVGIGDCILSGRRDYGKKDLENAAVEAQGGFRTSFWAFIFLVAIIHSQKEKAGQFPP